MRSFEMKPKESTAGGSKRYRFDEAVDLTHLLANGMPIYPGNPTPSLMPFKTLPRDGVNLSKLTLGSHTGTHIDAPRHFIEGGESIDEIPPSRLIGSAFVADLSSVPVGDGITPEHLTRALKGNVSEDDILLCYTGCSERWGDQSADVTKYTYLTKEAAEYLVSLRLRAVGVDSLSVEKFGSAERPSHHVLLGASMFLIESLSSETKKLVGQRVLLICLPIRFEGGDGAPARIVAVPML